MASTHEGAPQGEDDKQGPIEQVLHALGLGRKAKAHAADDNRPGAGLVDQAAAFQSVTVGDVMIPRADIVALEIKTPLSAVEARFIESEHSRLPIYRETLDDPVGFVHIKDVFKLMVGKLAHANPDEAVLGRLRRESLYVPAAMRAADLLLRMQARHIHLAMVIDEFGGVDGLVTLEDVIEAVVGQIDDEHDVAEAVRITPRPDGVFEIDGRAELAEVEAAIGRPLPNPDPEEEIDTFAGLVAAVAGRMPQRGEVIGLSDGLEAEITDADPRRIKRLRLRPVLTLDEPPPEVAAPPPSGPAAD
ncbi:MAG TPA: hemolysin family protein [Caulobacteraceae bacterium]|nr:hemolysin family protein [Caulobacteraceae bacterium]